MTTATVSGERKPVAPGAPQLDFDGFADRIAALPVADKADLLDLMLALPGALGRQDKEEADSIFRTFVDILTGRKMEASVEDATLPADAKDEAKQGPKSWKQFISKAIRDRREAKGWTQEELADRAGLTQSHISRIERMLHSPSHKTVQKIASAFELRVSELDPSAED